MKTKFLIIAALILLSLTSIFAQQKKETSKPKEAVKVGETAPDFALTDQDGNQTKLSAAVKNSKVVLIFYRGYWWPFCARQLAGLRSLLKQGEKAQIFAVSIDKADKSAELIKKIEADGKGKIAYKLLSDADAKTIDAYGLRDERCADKSVFGIPRPAIFVIDKKRKIVWAKIEDDYKKRPTNEEIRAELDKLKW